MLVEATWDEALEAAAADFQTRRRTRRNARTGVTADDIRAAARLLANGSRTPALTSGGVEQHSNGTECAKFYVNIALALGLPARRL